MVFSVVQVLKIFFSDEVYAEGVRELLAQGWSEATTLGTGNQ
jgi:hypothetical protein